jgi:glycosyltransferase involved in cell wall biosynthesis
MRQFLQERAWDLPVNFVGYIPDSEYLRLLNACNLVVIPSRNEPFGLVLLEAWSAKKPVVVSNVGGLGENVDSFMNGIKTDPDPNSLAWGISTLINDPSQAEVLGIRGRGKVDRVFQWSPIANRMTDAYARVSA